MADLSVRRGTGSTPQRTREWDPFQQMQELMNWDPFELANHPWFANRQGPPAFVPAFEVRETKEAYIFKADLPGVDEKDIEVTLTGDRVSVSGKREREKREESERFYAYERSFGSFSRAFTLPEGVDGDNVRADLKNGVLTLTLPKRPEVQPKRIQVASSGTEQKEHIKA
ncbi:Hsp20/alpha crystallin family protein [Stigmatella aurantiaca]|uniref:Spore protein SP21 n=2 Tax=Stigmatella aurantiaca TaxID=41 RepID=SP21_STIAD|nr:HSP20 family small heat-shock protein [Stigmatella aurantiaca]Q06823.2 RecName: Full=Spore protein SP21 [Stigmatella aurantiaca DW4/3-1]ADO72078.1 Heat shock protein, HSP20 family [Stigmatella aurantiaca DW4/3-1]EAU64354.1 HspA protein [Stigmatella aurantiaca DW4/3-1]CAB99442.1 HspA protein [Stigmatella aurantiaca DW4/3-1]